MSAFTSSVRLRILGGCRNRLRSRPLWDVHKAEVEEALRRLAAAKVLILAPNDGNIWAANPFCAVPSPFRVEARGKTYWGICIWDALGIVAALGTDAVIRAACGDCSEPMLLEIAAGKLKRSEGIIHFAVPAHHWWDNIGFT
jgi:Alkylmercury lyase